MDSLSKCRVDWLEDQCKDNVCKCSAERAPLSKSFWLGKVVILELWCLIPTSVCVGVQEVEVR